MTEKPEKERFDEPYDDLYDADGELVRPQSVAATVAALRRSKRRD